MFEFRYSPLYCRGISSSRFLSALNKKKDGVCYISAGNLNTKDIYFIRDGDSYYKFIILKKESNFITIAIDTAKKNGYYIARKKYQKR